MAILVNETTLKVNGSNFSMENMTMPVLVTAIRFICIPIWSLLLCFGLVGNIITVFVLRTKRLRQSSSSFYLTVLAITDMLYLLTSMLASLANYIILFPSEVRQLNAVLCVLMPFVQYTLTYISVWLLVAVTIERAIWVLLPFQARRICTIQTAKITVASITVFFAVVDVHFFFTMVYEDASCHSTWFTYKMFPLIDLQLAAVLPFTIMLIANFLIGLRLRTMRNFRKGVKVNTRNTEGTELSFNVNCDKAMVPNENNGSGKISVTEKGPLKIANGPRQSKEKSANLTKMLVSTNIFFMASVTPLLIYDVVYFAVDVRKWASVDEDFRGGLIFALERFVYTLWYTNFAIHFLLYCLSGPPFRIATFALFRRIHRRLGLGSKKPKDVLSQQPPATALGDELVIIASTRGENRI